MENLEEVLSLKEGRYNGNIRVGLRHVKDLEVGMKKWKVKVKVRDSKLIEFYKEQESESTFCIYNEVQDMAVCTSRSVVAPMTVEIYSASFLRDTLVHTLHIKLDALYL